MYPYSFLLLQSYRHETKSAIRLNCTPVEGETVNMR